MIYKVHWIIDGIAEIEADTKEEAEKKLQEDLENYVKNSDDLMNKFIAKSIQGTAYLPGEEETKKSDNEEKDNSDEKES
ncbi:MAG: translation initiation factor IF-2 [Rickettsiales bacterium]|nr:translation initiation factor IF-2 [Rickettsiales bacterium]|tara:strand:+ start:239 stop:475 length:237 start_codon:yes stop_codon:yes gene_type:complete